MHTTNRRDYPHRQAKGEQLHGGLIQMVTVLLVVIVSGLHNVAAQIPSRESVSRGHEQVPAPAWFESICQRHPDSPWSRAAMEFSATNQALHARFDLNEDRRLEASGKLVMAKDEAALGFPKPWEFRESDLYKLFSAADQDGDQRLNPIESTAFWDWIPTYFDVGGPLGLVRLRFQTDANKDSHLDASEFKYVISEVRRLTEQWRKRQPTGAVPE